jgi:lipid II:glycine glycyltransferase (peptidoglycan interpeptide bridge formation enzyme)
MIFKRKTIYFSEKPFDINGLHAIEFRDSRTKVDVAGFKRTSFGTLIMNLNREIDDIWKGMDKKSCRYGIEKAKKDGIIIKKNERYEDFLELSKNFREKKGIGKNNYDEAYLKKNGMLFIAEHDGELLAGAFFLSDTIVLRWLVGASRRLETDKRQATIIGNSNRLLLWEALQYAKLQGFKEFDFGGYYIGPKDTDMDGINSFKKSFGGTFTWRYNYFKEYSMVFRYFLMIYERFTWILERKVFTILFSKIYQVLKIK